MAVNSEIGMTFAAALRAMLRQAPNIIMVGEIRDVETASIAINASLTGHLVFSTLHTNDAPSAITRLVDMGVKPFLVSSSIRAVLAQRLIRKICPDCKEPYMPTETELRALNLNAAMKRLVLGGSWVSKRQKAVRFALINLAGRVLEHSRTVIIRLSQGHPSCAVLLEARRRIAAMAAAPAG